MGAEDGLATSSCLSDDTGRRIGAVVVMRTALCCLAFDDYTGETTTATTSVIARYYLPSWRKMACFFTATVVATV